MKKYLKLISVILCLFILITALVACNEKCTDHVDDNGDYKCDVCEENLCTHVDKNFDEKCDVCGADNPLNDGKQTYSAFVSNGLGGVYADVIIEFYQGENRVAMTATGADGCAYVRLALNKYTVKIIDPLPRNLYFDTDAMEVTPTNKHLEIEATIMVENCEKVGIMVIENQAENFLASTNAPFIKGEGAYRVEVGTSLMTPLVWIAEKAGIYTFTFESDFGVNLTQNGIPTLIHEQSILDKKDIISDSSFRMTVTNLNLPHGESEATPFVVCVKAKTTAGTGVLKVVRTADAPTSIYELPWNNYSASIPGSLNLPEDLAVEDLNYLSLTQEHELVYNVNDGLYHLGSENGKVVYIQLKHTPTTMRDAETDEPKDFFTLEALVENGHFGVYIFDEDGNVKEKNSYHDHALACLAEAHEEAGIYYLTTGMMKGVKEYGEINGWWNFDDENIMFGDKAGVSVLEEYAWMFCLCTID